MLSDGAIEITLAHSMDFNRIGFLYDFTEEELNEALDWFRERKPKSSGRRQQLILEELESRQAGDEEADLKKEVFRNQKEETTFKVEWDKIAQELQEVMHCGQQAVL